MLDTRRLVPVPDVMGLMIVVISVVIREVVVSALEVTELLVLNEAVEVLDRRLLLVIGVMVVMIVIVSTVVTEVVIFMPKLEEVAE